MLLGIELRTPGRRVYTQLTEPSFQALVVGFCLFGDTSPHGFDPPARLLRTWLTAVCQASWQELTRDMKTAEVNLTFTLASVPWSYRCLLKIVY